jgi:hypothetical protein
MQEKPEDLERLGADPAAVTEPDPLEALLALMRAEAGRPAAGPLVKEWAAAAAPRAAEASGRPGWGRRKAGIPIIVWKRRLATGLASAVLVVGGMTGLAWAANGSAPGEALYGLDRALEHVGIGNGGAPERLAEIRALFEAGDIPGGLSHAGEVVGAQEESPADEGANAAEALQAAAARVVEVGSEASAEVRQQVAALLTYLSENVGQVDGQQVAELARQIAGTGEGTGPPDGVPPVEPGPPVSVPPVDPPGPPVSVPPVDTGPPSGVPPDHPGGPPVTVPVVVGPPVEPGPPISVPAQSP